jgi:hypothetical protein
MIMRSLIIFSCTAVAILLTSNGGSVVAEDRSSQSAASYAPRLGNIMAAVQLRHSKLWYAGKVKNWPLADYELRQLNADLREATQFHPNVTVSHMTGMDKPAALLGEAIRAKDDVKFDRAFGQMTAACNNCHEAADRAFILIRAPTRVSPLSNQVFAPRER